MSAEEFAAAFIGALARDDFHQIGSLVAYLDQPDAVRGGDEASIIDLRVTQLLLAALGYQSAEIDYNLGKDNLRPDFAVRIARYPACCFVVEDKASTEHTLKSHRPQLTAYMTARRAMRGLLVNGAQLLGYDDAGPASAPTLQLSLVAAVRLWRGDDLLARGRTGWEALPEAERDALTVLWRRYGRHAFDTLERLIEDLTLDRDGAPHATDGSSWEPGRTRIPLLDARVAADALVETVQILIGELRADVAVQFAAREQEHKAFADEVARVPGSAAPASAVLDENANRILDLLPPADPRREPWRRRLREAMHGERPATEINEVAEEIRRAVGGPPAPHGTDALARAAEAARRFALRYGRHLARARGRYRAGVEAAEAYERWRAALGTLLLSGADAERSRAEYFVQTAYLVIVRMLMVRVFEDKGLTRRVFTNGGAALWFREVEPHYFSLAIGRSAGRLLQIAYENAQATYAHFYDDHRVFDWYVPDRNTVIRVLHQLAGFDLAGIDRDIIGTIYGRFVNDRHRHEQGMYYTPAAVVGFILDRVGWCGPGIVGARLLDPACGSGAFLVEAARRAIAAHRAQARAEGHAEIPAARIQDVLDSLRDCLVGFDLNPFACALAEINLLVQVLDLLGHAHRGGYPVRIERFRIYTTDALRLPEAARGLLGQDPDPEAAEDLAEEDQAKARLGRFAEGFDAVVGNPPYVRADEGAAGLLAYRRQVEDHPVAAVRDALTMKWDLFVPLALHLARRPGGRVGMIVSNALETVPYARALRRQLAATATVQEVHFFDPGVRLFSDAVVRNCILIAQAGAPETAHRTLRAWHNDAPPAMRGRQFLPQEDYGAEVFRPALPTLRVPRDARAEPLKHVCYVSVGMVLNAHERLAPGAFRLDDLLSDRPDATHTKPYVGSEDLRLPHALAGDSLFAAARIRYLEYGTARVPALIRRPTFPELYDREKVMVGKFGGAIHDNGTFDPLGFLTCNHTVFLFLPWILLTGVQNRAVSDRERELSYSRDAMEELSRLFPSPFLAGLFNSTIWQKIIEGRVTEAVAGGTQPNDFADQPIPVPDPALARDVGRAADAARAEGQALAALRRAGWQRLPQGWRAPPAAAPAGEQAAFAVARARWRLAIEYPNARCNALRRDGGVLLAGNRVAARLVPELPPQAADFLLRVLEGLGNTTLAAAEAAHLAVSLRPEDAMAAEGTLLHAERAALAREDAILARRAEIDALVRPLFESVPHPPIEDLSPLSAGAAARQGP